MPWWESNIWFNSWSLRSYFGSSLSLILYRHLRFFPIKYGTNIAAFQLIKHIRAVITIFSCHITTSLFLASWRDIGYSWFSAVGTVIASLRLYLPIVVIRLYTEDWWLSHINLRSISLLCIEQCLLLNKLISLVKLLSQLLYFSSHHLLRGWIKKLFML